MLEMKMWAYDERRTDGVWVTMLHVGDDLVLTS